MLLSGVAVATAALGCWAGWYVLVVKPAATSGRPFGPKWLATFVSKLMYEYGRWYLKYSDNILERMAEGHWKDGRNYVMCWHPHGIFAISGMFFVSHHWARDFPSGQTAKQFVCVAPLLLRVPFLAEYLLLCHARSQDRRNFNKLLDQGATVAVCPGGIYEQINTDEKQERLFFPANLGFIRLAIQHGTPLIPIYCFGENQLWRTAEWVRKVNNFFYKTFKMGNVIVLGAFGLPTTLLIPNPLCVPVFGRRLHIEFGAPVEVGEKEAEPSDARVKEVYTKYVAALQKMFDENAPKYLPKEVADRGLEIILRSK